MGFVQLEFDLETYLDADSTNIVEDRCSVFAVAISCRVRWCLRSLGRRSTSLLSTNEAKYVAVEDLGQGGPYVRGVSDA